MRSCDDPASPGGSASARSAPASQSAARRFPAERDAGAAVFVVRLQDELLAVVARELEQIGSSVPSATVVRTSLDQRASTARARAIDRALVGAREARGVPVVGQHGEERLLVRRSCSGSVLATQTARCVDTRRRARAHSSGARDDVVDQHAPVDEIDPPPVGRAAAAPSKRQLARDRRRPSGRRAPRRRPQDLELASRSAPRASRRWRSVGGRRRAAPLAVAGERAPRAAARSAR